MKSLVVSFVVVLFLVAGYAVTQAAYPEVVVALSDGSSYGITFLGVTEKTYSYNVREISGKNLSHFVLELPLCLEEEAFVSWTPVDGVMGHDPTTGGDGIKWNTESSFTEGVFSFTLDKAYTVGDITVYMKAATMFNSGLIQGPLCNNVVPSVTPTVTLEDTATNTPTVTNTVTSTPVVTDIATPTLTDTPTNVNTATPTIVNTPITETPTPVIIAPPLPPGTWTPTPISTAPTNEIEVGEPKRLFLPLVKG